jgi:hypothetical protein
LQQLRQGRAEVSGHPGAHERPGNRGWFRIYAITTLGVLMGFAAAAWVAIQGIEQNVTPWAGAFERVNAYTTFAWLIVLAVTTMRRSLGTGTAEPPSSPAEAKEPAMASTA